jgi:hypothetical protein
MPTTSWFRDRCSMRGRPIVPVEPTTATRTQRTSRATRARNRLPTTSWNDTSRRQNGPRSSGAKPSTSTDVCSPSDRHAIVSPGVGGESARRGLLVGRQRAAPGARRPARVRRTEWRPPRSVRSRASPAEARPSRAAPAAVTRRRIGRGSGAPRWRRSFGHRGSGFGPVAVTSRCGTQSSTWTNPSKGPSSSSTTSKKERR